MVGLMEGLVEHGMMQSAMDPVYEVVGEHEEAKDTSGGAAVCAETRTREPRGPGRAIRIRTRRRTSGSSP